MGIRIYTYPDPYKFEDLSYWDEIANAPHFCVSQTLVNGLKLIYKNTFGERSQVSTVARLENCLYSDWLSKERRVNQIVEVDKAIRQINGLSSEMVQSLCLNARSIAKSVAILVELGIKPEEIAVERLDQNQKILVRIYQLVKEAEPFIFKRPQSQAEVSKAILTALRSHNETSKFDVIERKRSDSEPSIEGLEFERIVIDSVHQFNPGILCLIDDLSAYFDVVLMFNYQHKYKEIYKTWTNIYSEFGTPIKFEANGEFVPKSLLRSFASNVLADNMGRLFEGESQSQLEELSKIKVTEFANLAEFANCVAGHFEKAVKKAKSFGPGEEKRALAYMDEQFYAPSHKADEILRGYFPEHFGERHFLDYPFGHFFVTAMNLWDPDTSSLKVKQLSDIRDCFDSGIISEPKKGYLNNAFNKAAPLLEDVHSLEQMEKIVSNFKIAIISQNEQCKYLGYFRLSAEEINALVKGFKDISTIVHLFFDKYEKDPNGFRSFYDRVHSFIVTKLNDQSELDDEMKDLVHELLDRLSSLHFTDGTPSFVTLKNTMTFYLGQSEKAGAGANWIVRGFEQVDGDILRTWKEKNNEKTYHFALLSDAEICASNDSRLPWPLDLDFLKKAVLPTDQNYRVFRKSKEEFKNFNRYALLYGLEFNRCRVALSYVKSEDDSTNDFYYVLRLLGLKPIPYVETNVGGYRDKLVYSPSAKGSTPANYAFSKIDFLKATLCPYRFAQESIIDGHSVYRNTFLVENFIAALIFIDIKKSYAGRNFKSCSNSIKATISSHYDNLARRFGLNGNLLKARVLKCVWNKLVTAVGKATSISSYGVSLLDAKKYMEFIVVSSLSKIGPLIGNDKILELLKDGSFPQKYNELCKYCASQDTCLKYKKG